MGRSRRRMPKQEGDVAPPPKRERKTDPASCPHKCSAGGPCCLNVGISHTLHICYHFDCSCHSERRYLEARFQREMSALLGMAA